MNNNDKSLNGTNSLWTESDMYWLASLLLDTSENAEFSEFVSSLRDERTADEEKTDLEDPCQDVIDALVTHGLFDAYHEKCVQPDRFVRLASNPEALVLAREAVQRRLHEVQVPSLDKSARQSLPHPGCDMEGERDFSGETNHRSRDEKSSPVGHLTLALRKYGSSKVDLNTKMELLVELSVNLITTKNRVRYGDVLEYLFEPASQERLKPSFTDNFGPLLADFFEANEYAERATVLIALSKDNVVKLSREVGLSGTFLTGKLSSAV